MARKKRSNENKTVINNRNPEGKARQQALDLALDNITKRHGEGSIMVLGGAGGRQ